MKFLSLINSHADISNKTEILDMLTEDQQRLKACEIGPSRSPLITQLASAELYGIEYPGCAELTRKAAVEKNKTIAMKECDIDAGKWPFPDNKFDILVSNQVLEHMSNSDHFFEEVYRLLKPGGYAIISTPNLSSLHNIVQLLLSLQPIMCNASDKFYGIGNPLSSHRHQTRTVENHSHLRLLTFRAMVELCDLFGFEVEMKRGGTFMGIPFFGRFLARIFPLYSYYCTVKIRKK